MAISVDNYVKIRYYKERTDLSQRKVSEQLKISRNTVRKYWSGATVPWERKKGSGTTRSVTTDEVVAFVERCLEEDKHVKNKKQHHTAKRIYDRLVAEMDFKGSDSIIRKLVASLKENAPRDVFVPLSYEPGEAIQADFGEAACYVGEDQHKVAIFCMRECYSNAIYVQCFFKQNEDSFLEGIKNGLEYFKGVPEKIIFDNAKVAVKKGFGKNAECTERYATFAGHYAFKPDFCNRASGHEKGLVEGLVGYVRRNVFVPLPHVKNIDELNQLLRSFCEEYMQHKGTNKEKTVGEMLSESQEAMASLPPYPMDVETTLIRRADSFATVLFESNKYSVPYSYANKSITVKAGANTVNIIYKHKTIASFERDYSRGKMHYELSHYMDLIAQRTRSALNAEPVKKCIPKILYDFLKKQNNPKSIIRVLRYYLERKNDVMAALKITQNIDVFEKLMTKDHPTIRPVIPNEITVNMPDINQYDRLIKGDMP